MCAVLVRQLKNETLEADRHGAEILDILEHYGLHGLARNPTPETLNPKSETRNTKPETQNTKPETRNPKPEILIPKPETRSSKPET